MNDAEARTVLARHLAGYRMRSYTELTSLVGREPETLEVVAPSGARYQLEIQAVWDFEPGGDVRILGTVDDGGWSATFPLVDDFIMAPDGAFAGEDDGGAGAPPRPDVPRRRD